MANLLTVALREWCHGHPEDVRAHLQSSAALRAAVTTAAPSTTPLWRGELTQDGEHRIGAAVHLDLVGATPDRDVALTFTGEGGLLYRIPAGTPALPVPERVAGKHAHEREHLIDATFTVEAVTWHPEYAEVILRPA